MKSDINQGGIKAEMPRRKGANSHVPIDQALGRIIEAGTTQRS